MDDQYDRDAVTMLRMMAAELPGIPWLDSLLALVDGGLIEVDSVDPDGSVEFHLTELGFAHGTDRILDAVALVRDRTDYPGFPAACTDAARGRARPSFTSDGMRMKRRLELLERLESCNNRSRPTGPT
jgi:hypothetical protein